MAPSAERSVANGTAGSPHFFSMAARSFASNAARFATSFPHFVRAFSWQPKSKGFTWTHVKTASTQALKLLNVAAP
ncbi:MAG: hypothetical protein IT293_11965 [Deltaproteobacteria bacterium]|nr:hypothetical protein [Deltaproteobacteria bacterium]